MTTTERWLWIDLKPLPKRRGGGGGGAYPLPLSWLEQYHGACMAEEILIGLHVVQVSAIHMFVSSASLDTPLYSSLGHLLSSTLSSSITPSPSRASI